MPEQTRVSGFADGGTVHTDRTASIGHNGMLDQDTFLFLRGQLALADAKLKEAKDARKKVRQHLENSGIALEELDEINAEEQEESETVRARWERRVQYAKWMSMPIGTQISFLDVEAVAKAETDLLSAAYNEGYRHGVLGKTADTQKWLPTTPEGMRYAEGWADGQKVLTDKFVKMNEDMAAADTAKAQEAADKAARKAEIEKKKAEKARAMTEKADDEPAVA